MKLHIEIEHWPVAGTFRIARRAATETAVVVVTLEQDGHIGRSECGPNVRYNESPESVVAQLESVRAHVEAGADRQRVQSLLPPGAARNALDCALWDLQAKRTGTPVWQLAGLEEPGPLATAYTISIDTPEKMLDAAEAAADRPVLKIKLAGDGDDLARLRAVRAATPHAKLIVDANEALTLDKLQEMLPTLVTLRVNLIEQPLPAADDATLEGFDSPIPLCADESCNTAADIPRLARRYDMINIKLDKTGGLTGALTLRAAARNAGLGVMVGCMLGTSLAMAPAMLVAQGADWVDLDGPLLLAKDRDGGITYNGSVMNWPGIWGVS